MKRLVVTFAILLPCLAQGVFAINPQDQWSVDKNKSLGNSEAAIRVEFFNDFQSPECRTVYSQWLPRLTRDFVNTGKVYFIFREYPLRSNQNSRLAAYYAVSAARIGKYSLVASALFQNQQSWIETGKLWETVATALTPAEQKRVQALVKDPGVHAEVQGEVDQGQTEGINQLPIMIVTSKSSKKVWNNWKDYKLFAEYVNGLLRR